ncbi:UNVERIFIED_CONTAM: hypothetical protein PYX00_009689 [Menopon gallinae]
MKKNDSGVSDESFKRKKMNDNEADKGEGDSMNLPESSETSRSEAPSEKGDGFPKVTSNYKSRNYRKRNSAAEDKASSEEECHTNPLTGSKTEPPNAVQYSSDSGFPEANLSLGTADEDEPVSVDGSLSFTSWVLDSPDVPALAVHDDTTRGEERRRSSSSSSTSSDSSTSALDEGKVESSDSEKDKKPAVLFKQKPKHKWFLTPEIVNRQFGYSNRKHGSELFEQRMYGSLHSVQRLELMYKLEHHDGCVNSLNFNHSGTLLASGSDDLKICLWNWPVGKLLCSFESCHKSNVFQAKFLPLSGDTHMATCARDGQVRIVELGSNGLPRDNRKVAQHRGPAHKLATQREMPHVFLSCGEDALVLSIDVRLPQPEPVLQVKEGAKKISLYSINSNPFNQYEFVVCGCNNYIRLYDRRNTSATLKKFCPQHLVAKELITHVTCAVFNYNGTEIVASYNDEDIYLFDTRHSDGCDFVHRYQGHRNNATVKGVNFFGPKSEFIVSGSDCGNIFFWERETEAIVQWMLGDENGVVNCLEPHPKIPVLATSGLDEDVKIWVPSCEQEPSLKGLEKTVVTNLKNRNVEHGSSSDTFDGQMLWILWRHIRRTERLNSRGGTRNRQSGNTDSHDTANSSADISTSSDDDQDGEDEEGSQLQCAPS